MVDEGNFGFLISCTTGKVPERVLVDVVLTEVP